MSKITIFWDNDGVLVNTEGLFFEATRKTLQEEAGVELTMAYFIEQSLHKGSSTFQLVAEKGYSRVEFEAMRDRRDDLYAEWLKGRDCLLEGVAEVLAECATFANMSVVTSSKRRHYELAQASSDVRKYFAFELTREDFVETKPDPEPYLLALKRSAQKPERCIVVEDTQRGVESAAAAGIRCLAVPHELSESGDFSKAYQVLEHIREVPKIIRSLS